MPAIDLTLTLSKDTPRFPGDPPIRLRRRCTFAKQGFQQTEISCTTHAGTHMDAPIHFAKGKKSIERIPLDWCMTKAQCIDVRGEKIITEKFLPKKNTQSVLFYTGWSDKIKRPHYATRYPVLALPLIHKLINQGIRIVGVDCPSIERAPYDGHRALAKTNRLILENLANLKKVAGKKFTLLTFPLKLKGSDGSPIRAVALVP